MYTRRFLIALSLVALFAAAGFVQFENVVTVSFETASTASGSLDLITGEPVRVTIRLDGNSAACPVSDEPRPVDVVLLIDVSSSMRPALPDVKTAAVDFLNALDLGTPKAQGGDQVGLVTFASTTNVLVPLTQDYGALVAEIDGLQVSGSTRISDALDEAVDIVTRVTPNGVNSHNIEMDAVPVIVMLSDGDPDRSDTDPTIQAAEYAREAGVRVVTIGLGRNYDTDYLRQLAYRPSDFYPSPSPDELSEIYRRIAQAIQPVTAARGLAVTYDLFDTSRLSIVPDSADPPALNAAGTQLQWSYDELRNNEIATFSFDLIPSSSGMYDSQEVGQVTVNFNPCETLDAAPPVVVSGPQLNILQPTPVPVTATPVPSPVAVVRQELPPVDITAPGAPGGFCVGPVWDLIPWGLLVLLVLLLVVWLFSAFRRYRAGKLGLPCLLVRLALLAYLIFAGVLFMPPLVDEVCPAQESVYFWRQSGSGTGIFLTHMGRETPVAFTELNTEGCVGCHTVSSASGRIAATAIDDAFSVVVYDLEGNELDVPPVEGVYTAWSPDGTQLAVANTTGDIEILNVENGTTRPLDGANDPLVFETMPSWGPNGRIAFVRTNPAYVVSNLIIEGPAQIYTVPETGGAAEPLAGAGEAGLNYYPAYSPDGRWLAFTYHSNQTTYADPQAEVYLVPAGGGEKLRLEANDGPATSNSWPSWNLDGRLLAFNSQRSDAAFDIFVTSINPDTGQSGEVFRLASASQPDVFEHTPFWGLPVRTVTLADRLPGLLPWLVPLLPLMGLVWWLCRRRAEPVEVAEIQEPPAPPPAKIPEPVPPTQPEMRVLWEVQPTLVIGLGESGRWVLTHLKKNIRDASLGDIPDNVRLLCIDAGDYTLLRQQEQPVTFAGVELEDDEMLDLRDSLSELVRRSDVGEDLAYRTWLNPVRLRAMGDAALDLSLGIGDERVPGRAALIENLRGNLDQTRAQIWDLLTAAAGACLDEQGRLHIVLVASTAEGFGSATVWDMAYLARRAAQHVGAKGSLISAHLLSSQATQFRHRNPHHAQVNSGATLRELLRFQLAEARPVPFVYGVSDLDGVCDWLLIDELTLYDGTRETAGDLGDGDPRWGVYPSVADSIAGWMDKAARQGALWRQRQQQTAQTRQVQARQRTVAVRSQGSFQFRLPFYDLLEIIQLRFARELVHRLLMGETPGAPRLDPKLAAGLAPPEKMAGAFWSGRMPIRPNKGPWVEIGYAALVSEQENLLARGLSRLAAAPDVQPLYDRLSAALTLILNGSEGNVFAGRQAKLGYAYAFLDSVAAYLPRIEKVVRSQEPDSPALQMLQAFNRRLEVFRANLDENALALGLPVEAGDAPLGLYTSLQRRGGDVDSRKEEMDRVTVRQYFWHQVNEQGRAVPLVDAWYRRYLIENMEEALSLLFWRVSPDGDIRLGLRTAKGLVSLDLDAVPAFEKAIVELAQAYCADIRERESLAKLLRQTDALRQAGLLSVRDFYTEDLAETARNLLGQAEPLLSYDDAHPLAHEMQVGAILAVNPNVVTEAAELEEHIRTLLLNPDYLERVTASDPYVLGLTRALSVMPVDAAPVVITDREQAYRREYGLTSGNPNVSRPIMSAVYEAEAAALGFERQLDRLRLARRPLHPLVVSTLADARRANAFCLALASSEVELRRLRGGRQSLWLISLEDERELVDEKLAADDTLHPLILGALAFNRVVPDNIVDEMLHRYATDTMLHDIWQEWATDDYRMWLEDVDDDNRAAVVDLLNVARLWVLG